MKTVKFYAEQFRAIHSGDNWLEVNYMNTLKDITADKAMNSVINSNSIWTIIKHVTFWRNNLSMKLRGEDTSGHTDFEAINDVSETAWKKMLDEFNKSLNNLTSAIEDIDEEKLEDSYKGIATYNELIQGTLQHDVYHLGQIILILKNSIK